MLPSYFVSGIGTGVGKTIASAILTQVWAADYWKPVQAGDLDYSDSDTVRSLSRQAKKIHPERFRLNLAASPHEAADADNLSISLTDFELPVTGNRLIVEGAGGLFVPINDQHFMIDLVKRLKLPVILVLRDYLGCINHSLLSINALRTQNIPLAYVLFNGNFKPATKSIIQKHLPDQVHTLYLPELKQAEATCIEDISEHIKQQLNYNSK